MCYSFNNKKVSLKKAVEDLNAEGDEEQDFVLDSNVNAFIRKTVPDIPAIVNRDGIVLMNTFWGIKQHPDAPTKGKNLQSENTPTFYRKIERNRCLIPASSYYEYKTVYVPGKKTPIKVKHELFWKDKAQFYIAGYYDMYSDGNLGFGLITTLPNPVQAEINNRMIITLDEKMGKDFLDRMPIEEFQYPNYSPQLHYENLEPERIPQTLF
ncbi:putative SOS response-associated peptidase YedK [Chryseobacterium sp. SORGH_AS909]|uniref:SOS response-associated peptidase YedK n=1 Tax=Chryseobacterium camelliae TaxID=1265445 RepID=A0ABU0TE45_9FLAO|nr:putative SOS response-associated peptidase YedK [Chryseobacterium camelliae]MDQ1099285.1 putative SOS response-associated peptidase YedK [Chryseobacterium sp. SORGH_AS_1048]MDR6086634.1 putative SOS response-associated peptidase YedK [Chryseobacterium sp. SORGH_AS_0909]MDR6131006.1 putative SOS response-associated peptidase YedK [Chryseobacterium sp. SORGH_AS_1175]MDT3406858.1 putative SOS response-associated peptidase YedK [Pseudacidovorax intermedius]